MTDELIIEQPQSGLWLAPGKRVGHLVAFFRCDNKETKFDQMSGKDKEVARFEFVDLDAERELMTGLDNHPGITNKLKVGNPSVVLGRIGTQPSQYPNDAVVLTEYAPGDDAKLKAWYAEWKAGVRNVPATTPTPSPAPPVPAPQPVPAPVPTPVPTASAPDNSAALAALLGGMDAGTLALLQKAAAQNGG